MQEVDRFPVEGETPLEQNGLLAAHIGGQPYRIESVQRDPPTRPGQQQEQEWVVMGEW